MIIFRLKIVWIYFCILFVFVAAVLFFSESAINQSAYNLVAFILFILAALIAIFGTKWLESKKDILVRLGDQVYFIENNYWCFYIFGILDPITRRALGYRRRDILNISSRDLNYLRRLGLYCYNIRKIRFWDIKTAQLRHLEEQRSYYAILDDKKYGVPEGETITKIWGQSPGMKSISQDELNKYRSGGDLVPSENWEI